MTVAAITRSTDAPRAIAVDGLCFAGKSTLIRHLAPLVGAAVAAEYTDLAPLPAWPPRDHADVAAALRHFLGVEQLRARMARDTGAAVVLLDRSPLTLISHECGMTALGVPADPAGAAELYADAAEAAAILTPHAYLYLTIPDPVTADRRARRGPVSAHLDHPGVRASIDHACRSWLAMLPPRRRLLLDGTAPLDHTAGRAAAFIADVGGPPAPSWRALAERPTSQPEAPRWTA